MNDFPEVGDKLKFTGVPKMYYPYFTDMKIHAENNFILNQFYTVSKVEIFSSWVALEFEGTPHYYNWCFFE